MRILSIETSCDETGISIMEATGSIKDASFKVLGDTVASQIAIHAPYGGVFPALAKREHIKNLPIVLEKTLREAKLIKKIKPVDLIAVTYGPGLEPALWTGIVFAKELATKWGVPVIPVNHMEGHMLSVFGQGKKTGKGKFKVLKIAEPTLSLLVSGGHTELVLTKKAMDYKIIGQTLDDAVGEAFDKVARMLGLPYPGGPEISRLAENERALGKQSLLEVREKENQTFTGHNFSAKKFVQSSGRRPAESLKSLFPFSLPRPMLHSKNFDFSYSGLKTAVLYLIRDLGGLEKLNKETKSEIALEFENAAIECLTYKTEKAIEKYGAKTLVVAGGVAANKHLRNEMKKITTARAGQADKKVELLFPTQELSTDNSIMIGIAGYLNFLKNKKKVPRLSSIKATGNLSL